MVVQVKEIDELFMKRELNVDLIDTTAIHLNDESESCIDETHLQKFRIIYKRFATSYETYSFC